MPYKDKEKQREYLREYSRKWYAIPENHYQKLINQRRYDSKHREEQRQSSHSLRKKRAENNLCPHCGAPLMEEEGKKCFNCIIKGYHEVIRGVLKYETAD